MALNSLKAKVKYRISRNAGVVFFLLTLAICLAGIGLDLAEFGRS